MRAMILAAGRGQRMRPVTDTIPKALLQVRGNYLIEHAIFALSKAGIKDIVINVSYLREHIISALGNGRRYDVKLHYSYEVDPLETGGGILQALPLLGNEPFIVLSCDIVTDYPFNKLIKYPEKLAHLVLVNNPDFHLQGDFYLDGNHVLTKGEPKFTFGNIGIYHPELFSNCKPGYFRLGDVLKEAASKNQVTGEYYQGVWHNIGTPEELARCEVAPL